MTSRWLLVALALAGVTAACHAGLTADASDADRAQYERLLLELAARSDTWVCATYGQAVRSELPGDPVLEVEREVRKRKLHVSRAQAEARNFKIGNYACQAFAALGEPDASNRTVTASGSRVQHVFRRSLGTVYVYTSGGKIVGWQD